MFARPSRMTFCAFALINAKSVPKLISAGLKIFRNCQFVAMVTKCQRSAAVESKSGCQQNHSRSVTQLTYLTFVDAPRLQKSPVSRPVTTSRRPVTTSRRLDFSSRRLVFSSRRVVNPSRRAVFRANRQERRASVGCPPFSMQRYKKIGFEARSVKIVISPIVVAISNAVVVIYNNV